MVTGWWDLDSVDLYWAACIAWAPLAADKDLAGVLDITRCIGDEEAWGWRDVKLGVCGEKATPWRLGSSEGCLEGEDWVLLVLLLTALVALDLPVVGRVVACVDLVVE